jgi:hypothetical protein
MNAGLLWMSRAWFSGRAKQVAVILHDAAILDNREVVACRRRFGLATAGAWRKPDRCGALGDGLLNVHDARIRASEDDNQINWSRHVGEACVRGQIADCGPVGPNRNDVVSGLVEIADDRAAVSSRSATCANHGDRPRLSQQSRYQRFQAIHVLHAVTSRWLAFDERSPESSPIDRARPRWRHSDFSNSSFPRI